uniref:Uncharacterized protein n=1 Tax=Gouania willdenowi TaxID=441366 RepID=A0A8C5E289_GOUWI
RISSGKDTYVLGCSICLELFTEPVSTLCGHNYCKACITGFWSHCDVICCPLCKETFDRAPKFRVNTEFRDILEMFKRAVVQEDAGSAVRSCDVPCDFCPAQRGQAVQSCLVCLASLCSTHLEPHHSVPALKWHQLVPPVESLQERVCGKHKKVHQFFCRREQQAICSACTKDQHVDHDFVPLEEEISARKSLVETLQRNVRRILSKKNVELTKIQTSNRSSRLNVEMMKEEIDKNFEDLLLLLKARMVELMEELEENQKELEQQAQQSLGLLQQEIHKCSEISVEMEKLLQTGNDFKLLQGLPSIPSYPQTNGVRAPKTPPLETVRKAVADIKTTVNQQMNHIMARVSPTNDGDDELDPETTENEPDDELGLSYESRYQLEEITASDQSQSQRNWRETYVTNEE